MAEAPSLRLRPWAEGDAEALAGAWAVADIAAQATVPGAGSVADAARWVAGAPVREATGVALDRVVSPVDGDEVWGEVGLARLVLTAGGRRREEWEVGWWVRPEHRGRGVATAAARLLLAETGVGRVVARIAPDLVASQHVARALGLRPVTATLWVTADDHLVPGTS